MGKPVREVTLTTPEEKTTRANALFDSGSFYTILKENLLPPETHIVEYKTPREFKTAGQERKVRIRGFTELLLP